MIEGRTVGVIIPCHNEERGLASLLPRCPAEVDEVVVGNNNSTDRTEAVARAHGANVVFEPVPGYGRTYRTGFAAAQSDILVTLDGDGQYPIQDVPRLVRLLLERKLDCLSGCRFPLADNSMPLHRKIGNVALTTAARLLFRVHIQDTQSGMWVFRRAILDTVRPTQSGMSFSEEFKLKVVLAGLKFGEEHIVYSRREGVSTLRPLRDGWENIRYLFRLRREAEALRRRSLPPTLSEQSLRAREVARADAKLSAHDRSRPG